MSETRMRVVQDTTPLNGSTIDVAARVAWAIRMARLTATHDDVRLRTIAQEIGTSAARLSRIETGKVRDGSVIDAYESVLGLVPGSLRAPVDIMCRTFPSQAPADCNRGRPISTVTEMSAISDRILSGEPVSGSDWLTWSRSLSHPANIALPERLARQAIARLTDGLGRAVSHGYATRYEALAELRCSAYGHLVREVARDKAAVPRSHGLFSLFGVLGERLTPEVVRWCLDLLISPDEHLFVCGALALENLGEISGDGFWSEIADDLLGAFDHVAEGSPQENWIAHLIRLAPATLWRRRGLAPSRPLPASPDLPDPVDTDAASSLLWSACRDAAQEVGSQLSVGDQPMLARLLFDVAYGHWEARALSSSLLVSAIPDLGGIAAEHLANLVEVPSDPALRARAARRLYAAVRGRDLSVVPAWLASGQPDLEAAALRVSGGAGRILPSATLDVFLRRPDTSAHAVEAAGMSQHPALADLAADPTLPAEVRSGLAWWIDHDGRLSD